MTDTYDAVLDAVGPRLRTLRSQRDMTLAQLSEATQISESTLSRLEGGQRKPTLELLLPLAATFGVQLDELVGAPSTGDPRVHLKPVTRGGRTYVPLTRRAGGVQAFKLVMPPARLDSEPTPRTHAGYEWLYVLDGRLRLMLGERDFVLAAGEAAEFDTREPHWLGAAGDHPVEVLALFGPQGERAHLRTGSGEPG